jgi:signal transduction histidine kinase/CheY-like chemotaxis protein
MVDPDRPSREGGERSSGGLLGRLPLASSLTLALVGLTVALALIAALGIGNLYSARQSYENALAQTYELEVASARLLAAAVAEEFALTSTAPESDDVRRRARRAFRDRAADAMRLARVDPASARLMRARIAVQERSRRLAATARLSGSPAARSRFTRSLLLGREAGDGLSERQDGRRAAARDTARDGTRNALLTTAVAGVLALLAAAALIAVLINSIRRPLDSLVSSTQKLAAGNLSERVESGGPQELRELDSAFNVMAERLQGAQTKIESEREKLSVTIESLGDALVVCDADGTVSAVNRRAEEIVPALEPGVNAQGSGSPLPGLDAALSGEVVVDRDDRTLSITAARLGSGGGDGVVWTLRDISERARLDRMKSDFVATASHELRSPLTSIKGFVELLERSDALGEREREFVGVILHSTDRLVDLVNDLLDVARLEAGRMEVHPRLFDLAELVREVVGLMGPRISEKDQRLDLDLPPGLPSALADPGRVRQILTNLISNAHQYTDEGGRITVTADRAGDQVEVTVADNGRGMTEEDLERVFDRFVRRDEGGAGTGLGLSIVRSLVDLQGGSIEVKSTLGEGTTFTVFLPAEPAGGRQEAPRQAIRGKRVLVVDDDQEVARVTAASLAPYEVETEIATDGDRALERLRSGRFDAITLEVMMDGTSGFEVLRALRADENLRRTPVVVVSIVTDHQALIGEWKVTKPVDPDLLADALGSAVLAWRTRVLVVGRSSVRPELEPALVRLGLDHEWVTSAAAAAQACQRRRFEIALLDIGVRGPESVLRSLDLRGRRLDQAVLLFSSGEDGGSAAALDAQAVPIEKAADAVLAALSQEAKADVARAGMPGSLESEWERSSTSTGQAKS